MQKILTIAVREYRAMVGTKAFAFSICMMPILMFGSILAMKFLQNVGEVKEEKIVVIDRTGGFLPALKMAALGHNAQFAEDDSEETSKSKDPEFSISKGSKYFIETLDAGELTDEKRLELSDQIRNREITAFVEIPENVHLLSEEGIQPEVKFYSEESGISQTRRWLSETLNNRVFAMRLQKAKIDFSTVKMAQSRVPVRGLGLLEENSEGGIDQAQEKDELSAIFLPMIAMFLMFMVTFLAAQPMLESVLEEKSQRIAEVLLGSANPTQLMTGKLLGTVAGSLTVFAIYAVGGYFVAQTQGYADMIPTQIVPWFIVFQIFGVMFYAAIFMAVGSCVSQLKEAQSMLLPVWMLMMIPMFVWIFIIQEPNGTLATWLSLFPPATPTTMVLRMATGATIPVWQPLLGLVFLAIATGIVVFVAGRIFRVGILWQGKTPKFRDLAQWAFSG
jgi:ABC-type Na+ efflux pump permease subunit